MIRRGPRILVLFVLFNALVACQMPVKTAHREGLGSNAASGAATTGPQVTSQDLLKDAKAAPGASGKTLEATVAPEAAQKPQVYVSGKKGADSGLLLAYEFTGDVSRIPKGGCRLKMENIRTHKDAFVALKADQMAVFKGLEPGRYFATRLSCGTTRIWNLDNLFGPGVDIVDDKVSYVGKVIFDFAETGELKSFRQAARLDSQKTFNDIRDIVSVEIISGFSMRPITPVMAMTEGPESFDVFAKGTAEAEKTLASLMDQLKRCAARGAKEDPLRLGHFVYVAKYKAGAFTEMKEKTETHALLETFTTCVDNALRTFQPPVPAELEVRVAY
ncbi:MAG: hypothetical protein NDI61_04105 [Bdellovibrionaceae bacterium]|nr:hypothetical protein [Pseudobdellovibrionaceae bacterium]